MQPMSCCVARLNLVTGQLKRLHPRLEPCRAIPSDKSERRSDHLDAIIHTDTADNKHIYRTDHGWIFDLLLSWTPNRLC
jgi:hypothetical protein